MKYFSMFSGIGGFELGIQQAAPSAKCVGFSEIDKWAISIYKKHFKELFKGHKNYGDANKINAEEIPNFDLLVGGFPCQSFSIAGKRKGFDDTRGTLFFEIARILKAKRPRHFILENVKGLLSHDGRRTFKTITATLDELGYDVEWQVLNSKDFSVPQNRERVFIVGHFRACGQSTKQIFPFRESDKKAVGLSGHQAHTRIERIGNINPSRNGANGNVFNSLGLCPTLTTNKGEGVKIVCFNAERGFGENANILSRDDSISYALTKTHANHLVQVVGGSQGSGVYDPKGLAVTLNALGGGGGAKTGLYIVHSQRTWRIRKLMPVECERLQGFPDNWTKYGLDGKRISDAQRYKCCGNAVTVSVVAAIIAKLFKTEECQ